MTFGATKREGQERDPDEVQIRIEFKACEPPEAINRIIEEYTHLISPIANPPGPSPITEQPTAQAPSDFALKALKRTYCITLYRSKLLM